MAGRLDGESGKMQRPGAFREQCCIEAQQWPFCVSALQACRPFGLTPLFVTWIQCFFQEKVLPVSINYWHYCHCSIYLLQLENRMRIGLQSNGRMVQWDATHQGSNPGARTFFWDFLRIYRCYTLSGKRRFRRRRGDSGDFENLQICRCSVLRRCSQGQGLRTCIHRV